MTHLERRGAPRLAAQLPLTLREEGEEIAVQTKNISASGAYCALPHYLAPMTMVQVRLDLPAAARHHIQIACRGAVVRVEPRTAQPRRRLYHVAIFFSDLTDHDRSTIAQYVQQHLERASSHE